MKNNQAMYGEFQRDAFDDKFLLESDNLMNEKMEFEKLSHFLCAISKVFVA